MSAAATNALAFWSLVLMGMLSVQWLWAMSDPGAIDVVAARKWQNTDRWSIVLEAGPNTTLGELVETVLPPDGGHSTPTPQTSILLLSSSGNRARRWAKRLRAVVPPTMRVEYLVGRASQFPHAPTASHVELDARLLNL